MNCFMNPLGPLLVELYNRCSWTKAADNVVKQHELPMDEILAHAGMLAVTNCRFHGDGLVDFDDDGEPAGVIEVLGEDDETTVDVCAWSLSRPETCGTFLGVAGVLGAARITNPASWSFGSLLRVHRRPLDWLKDGCRGVAILDHRLAPFFLADALGPLLAEDVQHARDLKLMLCRPAVEPRDILVPRLRQKEAA